MPADLSPICARLKRRGMSDVARIEVEFRRFVSLFEAHPDATLTPSRQVDDFLHELVLDTPRYRSFCQEAAGRFLDHIPNDGLDMSASFHATRELYRGRFGEPDPRFWSQPGTSQVKRVG